MSKDLSFSTSHRVKVAVSSVALAISIYFVAAVASVLSTRSLTGGVIRDLSPAEFFVSSLALVSVLCLGVWSITAAHKKGFRHFLWAVGLKRPKWDDLLTSLGLTVVYYAVIFAVFSLLEGTSLIDISGEQELGVANPITGLDIAYLFLTLSVLAPLGEELLFRGFLYGRLSRVVNKHSAMIFVSLLFALAHWPLVAMIDTFVLSLFMIVGYNYSKTLWVPIAMHAAKNSISVAVVFL